MFTLGVEFPFFQLEAWSTDQSESRVSRVTLHGFARTTESRILPKLVSAIFLDSVALYATGNWSSLFQM